MVIPGSDVTQEGRHTVLQDHLDAMLAPLPLYPDPHVVTEGAKCGQGPSKKKAGNGENGGNWGEMWIMGENETDRISPLPPPTLTP